MAGKAVTSRQHSRAQQNCKHQLVCSQTYKDLGSGPATVTKVQQDNKFVITRTRTQNQLNNSVSAIQSINLKRHTHRKHNQAVASNSVFEIQEQLNVKNNSMMMKTHREHTSRLPQLSSSDTSQEM